MWNKLNAIRLLVNWSCFWTKLDNRSLCHRELIHQYSRLFIRTVLLSVRPSATKTTLSQVGLSSFYIIIWKKKRKYPCASMNVFSTLLLFHESHYQRWYLASVVSVHSKSQNLNSKGPRNRDARYQMVAISNVRKIKWPKIKKQKMKCQNTKQFDYYSNKTKYTWTHDVDVVKQLAAQW